MLTVFNQPTRIYVRGRGPENVSRYLGNIFPGVGAEYLDGRKMPEKPVAVISFYGPLDQTTDTRAYRIGAARMELML